MRVLVLHSDIAEGAPPQDLDTLSTARAIAEVLGHRGHLVTLAPFVIAGELPGSLRGADIVFNMVETVLGRDDLAAIVPSLLDGLGIRYTGSGAASIALTSDKPLAKTILRAASLPTPDWAEPPSWAGTEDSGLYIVKSATQDASLALDDDAVVRGRRAIAARCDRCRKQYGGRWFAESFVEGREFNVALIEESGGWRVLPIPEMRFENWPNGKPTIVGFDAKWNSGSAESLNTVRSFGVERDEPHLAARLSELSRRACDLLGVKGYARVDFRAGGLGEPTILEVNPNPCLASDAGFAAAATQLGWSFGDLVTRILKAAVEDQA